MAVTTGKNAPRKIMKNFDGSPRPNQMIARGIHASGGMGRRSSIRGTKMKPALSTCTPVSVVEVPVAPERMPCSAAGETSGAGRRVGREN